MNEIAAVLDAFERRERGIPQAHIAAELVAELRRALATRSAGATISRTDLETALNIALAALGHFNTEQTDKHWNERERELREIEKRMRLSVPSASERIGDAARYRWLCNKFEMLLQLRDDETIGGELPPLQHVRLRCGIALDEWIDARIKEENATDNATDRNVTP